MAQVSVVKRNAVAYVGVENVTYGTTAASPTRMTIKEGSFEPSASQTEIDVPDERTHLADYLTPQRGLKSGSGYKFGWHIRPDAAQITALVFPTNGQGIVLAGIFGGESTTGGSLVATGTSATVNIVTAAQGSRFAAGQTVLTGVAGALEPVRVKSVSTDTLTYAYALSATPATGQLVVGTQNFYLTNANTTSLCFQHALVQDSSIQWTFNASTGALSFKTERDALLEISAEMKAATFIGPSAQSISTAAAAESMGSPFAMRDYFCLLQPVATTTRTHVPIEKFSIEFMFGMEHVPELATGTSGSVEGTIGIMRSGAVKPFAKIKITMRYDSTVVGYWSAQTPLQFVLAVPQGSGTTKRWCGFDIGTMQIVGKPTHPGGDRELIEFTAHAQLDTSTSGSTGDLALSPARFFVG